MSPEEIFENAEMQFASEDFDGARRNFKRALDLEPEVRALLVCVLHLLVLQFLAKLEPEVHALLVCVLLSLVLQLPALVEPEVRALLVCVLLLLLLLVLQLPAQLDIEHLAQAAAAFAAGVGAHAAAAA